MKTYRIPLIPGPTLISTDVLALYHNEYGSSDCEPEFFELYSETQNNLGRIIETQNKMALMNGEAMIALWGALKSTLEKDDKILAITTGMFGCFMSEIADYIGCNVEIINSKEDEAADINKIESAIKRFQPKMVTIVHCETSSGIINSVEEVGKLIRKYDVPLYCVDAVSSAGGTPVKTDDWSIDLCLVGTQKCLSAPPDMGIIAVSDRAWKIIKKVNYQGYDALLPWENALKNKHFPYTLSWHSTAAINKACQSILEEGIANVFKRHEIISAYCRNRVKEMGLLLFAKDEKYCSPTVTTIQVPKGVEWKKLNANLRTRKMVVGQGLGDYAGKVFRIGHMGEQANQEIVEHGMDILEYILLLREF